MSEADEQRREAIDRPLGWLTSLGGCVLILDQTLLKLPMLADVAPWWNLGGLLVVLGLVVLAVAGLRLPMPALQVIWRCIPALYLLLQACWPLAYRGTSLDTSVPWLWTLEPAVITLLLLWLRPVPALALGFAFSLVPALSSLLLLGRLTPGIRTETTDQLGNVVYLAVFIGLRVQLQRRHASQWTARQQRRSAVRVAARRARSAALQRVVHDEVLSVLTAAMYLDGQPPQALRQQAGLAIAELRAFADNASESIVAGPDAVARLVGMLRRVDDSFEIDVQADHEPIPDEAVTAIGKAGAEALRNSLLHGGEGARRWVHLELSGGTAALSVRDDGVGFHRDAATARTGITDSILGRMADAGGVAQVQSAPGSGTTVRLRWPT